MHHTIEHFVSLLPTQSLVLDLGCGHGVNTAYFRDQGMQIEAWDLSTAMQQVAKRQFDIDVQLLGFDDLNSDSVYDGICANYSLLHMQPAQVPSYLEAMSKALKPNGVLHLGMKLGDSTERDSLGRFYAYYPEQQLIDWLAQLGLQIEYSHQSIFAGLAGNPQTGIAMQARKIKPG